MRAAPGSELYPALVDVAPVFAIFATDRPAHSIGVLWGRLKVATRITWCHAACIPGDHCLLAWSALSRSDQTALYVALSNMIDFFEEAGA